MPYDRVSLPFVAAISLTYGEIGYTTNHQVIPMELHPQCGHGTIVIE